MMINDSLINELKSVLSDYFANRLSEEIDKMWENGDLSEDKIESFRHLHPKIRNYHPIHD